MITEFARRKAPPQPASDVAALSVPVMTRLRQPERRVLDTLVDAGVARSRSEALAWAVALVGEHTTTWLGELREAMATVDDLRARGPRLDDATRATTLRRHRHAQA